MNWINLDEDNYKVFELFRINNQTFNNLELKHMLYANAKYGGPIAITSHPDHILMASDSNNVAIQNICIFKNNGFLHHTIPKLDLPKIVGFDFIEDELLFVMTQTGRYLLIDPHKGTKREYDIGNKFNNEPIVEGKVVDNSIVFYTFNKDVVRFYFIKNIFDQQINQFQHSEMKMNIQQSSLFFYPVSSKRSLSEKLECQITHPVAGIIRLIEDEPECIFYNNNPVYTRSIEVLAKLPEIKSIKLIAMSSGNEIDTRLTAYITESNLLYIVSANFSDNFIKKFELKLDEIQNGNPNSLGSSGKQEQNNKKLFTLLWCGEDALVLIHGKQYQIISKNTGATITKRINTKGIIGYQEIDGVKLVTNTRCEILRKLLKFYSNVFQINSKAKGIDLYYASNEFENHEASYQNSIIMDKKGLQEGVEDCLSSACFETDRLEQRKLLQASHFGKTFLTSTNSKFEHDTFAYACKTLRVVNSLRNDSTSRAITYDQFISLEPAHLIKILLRYQLYYLADEICKFLSFDQRLISNVYVSWACAKIEGKENDETLAIIINDKLKFCQYVSYTEIAKKAVQLGKKKLANKLIEFEPSIKRKVPVLLWMGNFDEALKEAIKSRDPNLIYEVIFRMMKFQEDPKVIFNIIGKFVIAKPYLIYYLKNFEPTLLDDFYLQNNHTNEERGLYFISKGYQNKDLMKRLNIIRDIALKNLGKEKFYDEVTKEYVELITRMTTDSKVKVAEEKSLKQYIELFMDLFEKNKFKMTDHFDWE